MDDHKRFTGVVRFKDGLLQEVEVEAMDHRTAWQMLEFSYGQGNVQSVNEVHEPARSTSAPSSATAERRTPPGQDISLILGAVAFVGLYMLGLDWRWALGVGVVVWFGLAFRAMRQ